MLSPGDLNEDDRAREISRALNFYLDRFTLYLATTISITESIPDEANNQLRNALTHLARANQANDAAALNKEVASAIAHFERANRDCLKVSIIKARDAMDQAVTNVRFFRGSLTPKIEDMIKELKEIRRRGHIAETRGDETQTKMLEEILRLTLAITDEIHQHYQVSSKNPSKLRKFWHKWGRLLLLVLAVLIGTLIRPYVERVFVAAIGLI